MKARLVFVPPNGGETDYSLDFDLPGVPQHGDYIQVVRPETQGTCDFIVRRTWWILHHPTTGDPTRNEPKDAVGTVQRLMVECEYALSDDASESHKSGAKSYDARKGGLKKFDASCY